MPIRFHEEDFRVKEPDGQQIAGRFADLEFSNPRRLLLGDDFSAGAPAKGVVEQPIPQGVQTDLFGNIITSEPAAPAPQQTRRKQRVKTRGLKPTRIFTIPRMITKP